MPAKQAHKISFIGKFTNFLRFSIHEHATYDVPAALNTCLKISGKRRICYIGHSMGTTIFLAMCSNNTLVMNKIKVALLLAPVVEPCTMKSPLKHLAPAASQRWFALGFESVGIQEFLPDWTFIRKLVTAPWLQSVYAFM